MRCLRMDRLCELSCHRCPCQAPEPPKPAHSPTEAICLWEPPLRQGVRIFLSPSRYRRHFARRGTLHIDCRRCTERCLLRRGSRSHCPCSEPLPHCAGFDKLEPRLHDKSPERSRSTSFRAGSSMCPGFAAFYFGDMETFRKASPVEGSGRKEMPARVPIAVKLAISGKMASIC